MMKARKILKYLSATWLLLDLCQAFMTAKNNIFPATRLFLSSHTQATTTQDVTFPPMTFRALVGLPPGECIVSEAFTVADNFDFRVKLYPQGLRPKFGLLFKEEPRVGVYLQFLPRTPDQTVDAAFGLRLIGNQKRTARFDVEWRAGMRFQTETNLSQGVANDFGAHLMQTTVLNDFLGVDTEEVVNLRLVVEVKLFDDDTTPPEMIPFWSDVRPTNLRVASVVVPVLNQLSERQKLMSQGVYPGVEYRILRILHDNNEDVFHHQPGVRYEMKPIYPLVKSLERPWPISIVERDIPKLVTPRAYNVVSALGSLATAVLGLTVAFLLSSAISFFYIPSRSMEPTLQIGDVLLVEKVRIGELHRQDIVLFQPPSALQDIVAANGGRLNPRDLFVKRLAGLPGDEYNVEPSTGTVEVNGVVVRNQLCQAENGVAKFLPTAESKVVPDDSVLVLGDCGNVSIDSRVWGPLPKTELVGRPLVRVWPMDRMGPVQ